MINQPEIVDDNGDIFLHGRQGASIILEFKDVNGVLRDMSAATVTFEVGPLVNVALTPVVGNTAQMELVLTQADVKAIYNQDIKDFVFLEAGTVPNPVWRGTVYVSGWVE